MEGLSFAANMAIVLCFFAEFFCNHALFTLNYLFNVIETSLWTVALGLVTPYALHMTYWSYKIDSKDINARSVLIFSLFTSAVGISFVGQLLMDHIPL